jgi:hypothetical protein
MSSALRLAFASAFVRMGVFFCVQKLAAPIQERAVSIANDKILRRKIIIQNHYNTTEMEKSIIWGNFLLCKKEKFVLGLPIYALKGQLTFTMPVCIYIFNRPRYMLVK